MRTRFTLEQTELLKANPYTADVTATTIKYTLAFKQYALQEYERGLKPKSIFENAGYDISILGTKRIDASIIQFRKQAASPKGLRPSTAELKAAEIRKKDKTIKDLNTRIDQLEREMELLKKSYLLKMKYLPKE